MLNVEQTIKELDLKLYKDRGDQLFYWCPLCGDHPNHTHAHFNINRDTGAWHCFLCNAGGLSIESLCNKLGKNGIEATDTYIIKKETERKEIKTVTLSDKAVRYYFDTLQLKPLENKNFKIETLEKFEIKYDEDLKCHVFMLCNSNGKAVGYSVRNEYGYFHQPEGIKIKELLYGYHFIEGDEVYVVEGQTDTLRLFEAGLPAVGVFGNIIKEEQVDLLRKFKKITLIPDNDDTLLRKKNIGLLSSAGKLVHFSSVFYVIPDRKDIEEYPTEEVGDIVARAKPISRIYDEIIEVKFSP